MISSCLSYNLCHNIGSDYICLIVQESYKQRDEVYVRCLFSNDTVGLSVGSVVEFITHFTATCSGCAK